MSDTTNNVKKYRMEKYWSQEELARYVEVSAQTIRNIEAGRSNPILKTKRRLSEVLGVPVVELFPSERVFSRVA